MSLLMQLKELYDSLPLDADQEKLEEFASNVSELIEEHEDDA